MSGKEVKRAAFISACVLIMLNTVVDMDMRGIYLIIFGKILDFIIVFRGFV